MSCVGPLLVQRLAQPTFHPMLHTLPMHVCRSAHQDMDVIHPRGARVEFPAASLANEGEGCFDKGLLFMGEANGTSHEMRL